MAERDELFRDLLERNYPRWKGIARCYGGPNGRDDLMQEIAMQVWKSLDSYSGRAKIDT